MENLIEFDLEEKIANDHLMALMRQLDEWGLNCNQIEVAAAVHILQSFIIKHMLQRLGAKGNFSEWYGR